MVTYLILTVVLLQNPRVGEKQQKPAEHKSEVTKKAPTTSETPTVANNLPATEKQDSPKEQSKWWVPPPPWDIYWPTIGLVIGTGFAVWAALKTLRAINAQVVEMRETGKQTEKLIQENIAQTQSMSQQADSLAKSAYHLGESANATHRSASAMERIAEKIAASTEAATASVSAINKQMRAYLFVVVGSGAFQDRASNLKFAAAPTLVNAGNTPAYKVAYRAKTAILPIPIPNDFTFPLPEEPVGGTPLGPHQNATLNAIADDFCPDEEVEDIKVGAKGKVLYVWGVVTYKDVFGDSHVTKFCHSVNFLKAGAEYRVTGFYIGRHEEAD
jgi:hypothetical protein